MYQLITKLKDHNIHLLAENDNLKIQFNGEKFPEDLLQQIKENKQALISYLTKQNSQAHQQIETVAKSESYPLSSAQKRLWVSHQVENGAVAYNMANQTVLSGSYDVTKFEAAIKATIAHHEILRTVFREDENGEGRQWVLNADTVDFTISFEDFSNLDATNRQEKIAAYIDQDATKPFDFENGPLLRAAMLQTAANEYVFYYNMHHIISDGWSMDVLAKNVMMAYEAIVSGKTVVLPELRIQYKDYASWQLQQLEETTAQNHKKYWLEQLEGELPVVDFPTSKKRPAVQTTNGRSMFTYIDKETSQALKKYAQAQNGSLFIGLLAVFNTLFYRYTRQEDFIVGTPVAGRDHADLENQIGFYVNTLALRNQVTAEQSFEDVFTNIKDNTLEAYSHQAYPFNQLTQDLQLKRDVSRNVVFDIMLTLHNLDNSAVNFQVNEEDVQKIIDQGTIPSKFDLELNFKEIDGYLYFDIIYNEDVYENEMIKNLMQHFKVLVNAATKAPTKKVNQLAILPKEELVTLEAFNATEVTYNEAKNVVDLFAAQVANSPNKTALIYEGKHLTFRELDEKSNQVANYIETLNLTNTLIPICVDRSFEMIIGIWGILKSGNAYVPVDPTYPQDRIDYILEDTKATQVFCNTEYTTFFKDVTVVDLDQFDYAAFATTSPNVSISEDQLAYCIYTSGTTGKPKGVLNAHSGLTNRLFWMRDDLNITANSVLFHKTPYVFDVSVWELTMPFIVGCTLVIARPEGHLDPEYLQDTIEREGVTFMHFVPSMLNVFIDVASAEKLQSLTHIVCSGEALSSAITEKTKQLLSTTQVCNLYGPTEAAIDVTAINLTTVDTEKEGVSIGKPVANTKLYVVNADLELQPVGVVGELLIGGIQVAKGYVNKPELTAEKFIKNPFQTEGNVYRTGDLVRWLPNGTLDFLGRKDDQVKINGFRIELGEINNAIEQLVSVKQAVAIVDETRGNKRLLAYFVAENELTREEIQKELKGKLPEYMIPADFMQLETIPLTINGKVNRKALPGFLISETETTNYVAPRNKKEEIITTIWQEVLRIETVGIYDNFFSLGGDSIIAIQFISKAKKQGIVLKVKDVFEFQTIDELSTKVNHEIKTISEQGVLEGNVGLLPIQEYFFEKEYTRKNQYNQSLVLTVPKNITENQLSEAVAGVYQKHDALRMRFELIENQYVSVYETTIPELAKETITATAAIGNEVTKICTSYQEALDIETGTVARFVLINTPKSEESNRLFIVAHHLVIDGVSWRILAEDLTINLQKIAKGETVSLGEKTTSFRQWQERLTTYANSEELNTEYAYWKSITEKIETLPQDTNFEGNTTYKEVGSYDINFSKELTNDLLKESNQAFSTEINDLLLASLAMSFATWTNTNNLVIGLEGHGREELFDEVDLTETVGWFTSLYPVLLENFEGDVAATIVQAKENLKAIPNKGIGYGALRYLSSDERKRESLNENIEQVIFNYLGQADQGSGETASVFNFTNESKGEDIHPENEYGGKITINGVITGGTLNLRWDFDSNRYSEETITTLAENYKKALETVVNFCKAQTKTEKTPADYGLNGLVSYRELKEFKANLENQEVEDIYQLSPLQEGMLLYSVYNDEPQAYLHQISFDLNGEFDLECFKKSWESIIDKHSVLRTSFHADAVNIPLQCVHKSIELPLTVFDYTTKKENEIEAAILAYINEDAVTAFDISKAPLFRLTLLKQAENSWKLVYTTHHIISDGWSSPVLFGEYLNNYKLLSKGEELVSTNESDNYKDFISHITAKDENATFSYWKNQLSMLTEPSLLPFSNSTDNQNATFGNTSTTLSKGKEYVVKLEAFAKKNHLTVNTIVQGVWAYLLSQYTNNETVVFGTVISGRPTEIKDIEKRVGLYINTIPLCTTVQRNETIVQWLNQLQSTYAVSREEYGHSSLVDIQAQSGIVGALFDSIIVFENYPLEAIKSVETDVIVENIDSQEHTNYELTLSIGHVSENELSVDFDYNSSILSEETIQRITSHFDELLGSIIKSETIAELNYITAKEQQKLVVDFNDTTVIYPEDKTYITLFNEQVEKTPQHTAIICEDVLLTYEELDKLSNKFVSFLVDEYKIEPTNRVAIKLPRTEWLAVALLGTLKAGACYVPIDVEYPEDRIQFIENDSNCVTTIDTNVIEKFKSKEATISSQANETITCTNENPAYIIYTSGSTGKPKGVEITHASFVDYVMTFKSYFQLTEADRMIHQASISFDTSIEEIYPILLSGGSLVIPTNTVKDIESLLITCKEQDVTIFSTNPPVLQYLNSIYKKEDFNFRILISGGDVLKSNYIDSIWDKVEVYNTYGPTESTVCATYCKVDSLTSNISIGKPIANREIYILDAKGNSIVPQGIVGEICIGGKGLATGYINRPELTKEKFITHPFKNGQRLYRTGDLGKWLDDGSIAFVGRKDDQVKIRGYRIETGEIENAFYNIDAIESTAVVVTDFGSEDKELVAYFTTNSIVKEGTLRDKLSKSLPSYMLPSYYIELEELPLTPNGKVDKKKLASKKIQITSTTQYVAPRNTTEKKLAEIWQTVLRRDSIGIYENFFMIGGHSIKAIDLINRCSKEFQVKISLKDIFTNSDIASQAILIDACTKEEFIEISKIETQESYPISDAQRRLWVLSQLSGGSSAYNMPFTEILRGEYDIEKFKKAIYAAIDRHEILRTTFKENEDGDVRQWISKKEEIGFTIDFIDLKSSDDQNNKVKSYIAEDSFKDFDLENGPLLRAAILQTADEEYIFYYNMHHIISDGWSTEVLSKDVLSYYNAYKNDESPKLEALNIQYKDYASWQLTQLESEAYDAHQAYWLQNLSGELPVLDLPSTRFRPKLKTFNGISLGSYLNKETSNLLKQYVQENGGSLFMNLQATFKVLMYHYTSQKDIIIGSPVAGRDHVDLKDQIGFYVNTLALRDQIDPQESFDAFYQKVKENTLEAYVHQSYPFDRLVDDLALHRDVSRNAVFDVMLILQNKLEDKIQLSEEETNTIHNYGRIASKLDLAINFQEIGDCISFNVTYNTDVYENNVILNLIKHYKQLINALLSDTKAPIFNVSYLTASEQQEQLITFNETEKEQFKRNHFVDLFEKEVEKAPFNIALKDGTATLTFDELNSKANKFAHYLKENYNVQPQDTVGVMLDKSNVAIVSILAIFKLGAIYLPVNISDPIPRKEKIINDAKMKALLIDANMSLEAELKTSVIPIDIAKIDAQQTSQENLNLQRPCDDIAYILYTSGSTGEPKGAKIKHEGLANLALDHSERLQITSDDCLTQFTSFSFDVSMLEISQALLSGATLFLLQKDIVLNVDYFLSYLKENKVTIFTTATAYLANMKGSDFSFLKSLITGGETPSLEMLSDFAQYMDIYNAYGPTECTVTATIYKVPKSNLNRVLIGRPIANVQVYVLGENLQLVPKGVAGELYIGGIGVSLGYLNREELTNERFINNPFKEGEKIYKTGDLVCFADDGNIEFIGRKDNQVKIRGYRIELGEIESALTTYGNIESVLVLAKEVSAKEKELVAYFVSNESLAIDGVRKYLNKKLPSYMVPSYFVQLDQMPLTPNGKICKKQLLAIKDIKTSAGVEYIAPKDEMETQLVALWQEILKKERIGIRDSFFDIGGNSLKAIQIISRIQKEFQVSFEIASLYENPTIEAIKEKIENTRWLSDQFKESEENIETFSF